MAKSFYKMKKADFDLKQDIREVEDLVIQIKYFIESVSAVSYAVSMTKNLARHLLKLLQIETLDIEHLFKQEQKHWEHAPYIWKKQLSKLHKELAKKDAKIIKSEVRKILEVGRLALVGSKTMKELREISGTSCSKILKVLKSEHSDLAIVKDLLKTPATFVKKLRRKKTSK